MKWLPGDRILLKKGVSNLRCLTALREGDTESTEIYVAKTVFGEKKSFSAKNVEEINDYPVTL